MRLFDQRIIDITPVEIIGLAITYFQKYELNQSFIGKGKPIHLISANLMEFTNMELGWHSSNKLLAEISSEENILYFPYLDAILGQDSHHHGYLYQWLGLCAFFNEKLKDYILDVPNWFDEDIEILRYEIAKNCADIATFGSKEDFLSWIWNTGIKNAHDAHKYPYCNLIPYISKCVDSISAVIINYKFYTPLNSELKIKCNEQIILEGGYSVNGDHIRRGYGQYSSALGEKVIFLLNNQAIKKPVVHGLFDTISHDGSSAKVVYTSFFSKETVDESKMRIEVDRMFVCGMFFEDDKNWLFGNQDNLVMY